jgi:hypothetical protein
VRGQGGQSCVEFVAVVCVVCVALGGVLAVAGPGGPGRAGGDAADGRAVGGFFARHLVCAVAGRCDADERALADAYGERDARRVRELAPHLVYERGERQLPVDWRECRRPECATAPDDPGLDTHVTDRGLRATAFTRLIRRGGRLYVSYWLYYPDSNTTLAGSDRLWERSWLLPRLRDVISGTPDYPGYHRDDWEGVVIRVDPDGSAWARASSHGRFQGCRWSECGDRWARRTGWVRVSRGSHSGHVPFRMGPRSEPRGAPPFARHLPLPNSRRRRRIPLVPGRNVHERSTTGEGLRLIPLETHDRRGYRALDPDVRPPWRKRAYGDPETDES